MARSFNERRTSHDRDAVDLTGNIEAIWVNGHGVAGIAEAQYSVVGV